MAQVIFSFDTEDFITSEADDAVLKWAQMLTRHGVKGCFCLVGERARALRRRGRTDVIQALKQHEIGYHSDTHSLHPLMAEYLEGMDWDDGVVEVTRREAKGIEGVAEVFGQFPTAFIRPGNDWAPQVLRAMDLLGIHVYGDANFEMPDGNLMWYCNSLLVKYHLAFDTYFDVEERLPKMKEDFDRLLGERKDKVIVIFTHPCRLMTERFWDELFVDGRNPPRADWRPVPLRPPAVTAELIADFDKFIAHVMRKPQVKITTFRELYESCREQDGMWVPISQVVEMARRVQTELDYQAIGSEIFSPAEIFGILTWVLMRFKEDGYLPTQTPLRRILGPVELSPSLRGSFEVSAEDLLLACYEADGYIEQFRRMPGVVHLGQKALSPGTFLGAMARLVTAFADEPNPPSRIVLKCESSYPEIAQEKDFQELRYQGTWQIFP
ncbi:MAG: hypothetical protein ACE5NJ_12350, partial [Thermodesulfobacteriota bacterium]